MLNRDLVSLFLYVPFTYIPVPRAEQVDVTSEAFRIVTELTLQSTQTAETPRKV
jgi:hypothetical protein